MDKKADILEQFVQASDTIFNPAIKDWKRQGGKVVGLFCSYIPEEIVYAAGLLPMRMRATGSYDTARGDDYLCADNCSFARHCLSVAFDGGYDFLDGVAIYDSCDNVRRLYDVWHRKLKTPFQHYLNVPRTSGEGNIDWYRGELVMFKEGLEKHFGVDITEDKLRHAIRVHNETRDLQRQLYTLRMKKSPPITGTEVLTTIVAGTAMPKDKYNELLRELLGAIVDQDGQADYRARLMIVGSGLDDSHFVKLFEDLGGLVVTDYLCYGTREFWYSVDETAGDPLEALARFNLRDRLPCQRMVGQYPRTLAFIKDMREQFKVDGVVFARMKFCDVYASVSLLLGRDMREASIPFLELEREYVLGGIGQHRTRIQAFLEIIEG
jgi:benzoyl-CoA reductase/2-hydroxyglutaryl-CoA dehydratase subunit BcrC/BadD/HgdB